MTAGVPLMQSGKPNPTGTGRYCMPAPGTCYCGECPHWSPAPAYDASHINGSLDQIRKTGRRAAPEPPRRRRRS